MEDVQICSAEMQLKVMIEYLFVQTLLLLW